MIYLSLYLSNDLSWAKHIDKLCTKLSQKVAILGRIKSKVPKVMLERVYKTIIQPNIDYCITVWGYATNVHISKVQSLQNRAARIVSGNYDWTIRGIDVVKQVKWETVEEHRDYFAAILMYRCLNSEAPFYIANHFTRVSHNHFTRRSQYDAIVHKPNLDVLNGLFCTKAQFYGII